MYRVKFTVNNKGSYKVANVKSLETVDKCADELVSNNFGSPIIIFDIDGTIADHSKRFHYIEGKEKDWDSYFGECSHDEIIAPIFELLQSIVDNWSYTIYLVTGRNSVCAQDTIEWLYYHEGACDELFMRKQGDYRPDDVIKEEWLLSLPDEIRSNIRIVFEDRKRVVDMWRKHGIQCCQVSEGDF